MQDALRALARRSKASWGYSEEFLGRFEALLPCDLARPGRTVIVAEDGVVLVGFAVVNDEARRAWLDDLWVDPPHFGEGIGRRLFHHAVNVAREWGQTVLELESDANAEGFYRQQGAVRLELVRSSLGGERHLPHMRLVLDRPLADVP